MVLMRWILHYSLATNFRTPEEISREKHSSDKKKSKQYLQADNAKKSH